jgi:ketosteroid isomerase-like protein
MSAPNQNEAQIRQLMAAQETAMRNRDVAWLVGRYAPDVVAYTLAPPLAQSSAGARDADALRAWFGTFDGPIDYEIRDLAVTCNEDIAYCHSLNRLSATPTGTTDHFDLWFRSTVCLRKIDGNWIVTHEHTSTPFYMDGSFQAALDLTP